MDRYQEIAQRYLEAWNATDEVERSHLVTGLFSADATYVDPLVSAAGPSAISDVIAGAQAQFPSWTFRLLGEVDGHHEQLRFRWQLGPSEHDAPVEGFDAVALDADGRIRTVLGFLDRLPA